MIVYGIRDLRYQIDLTDRLGRFYFMVLIENIFLFLLMVKIIFYLPEHG